MNESTARQHDRDNTVPPQTTDARILATVMYDTVVEELTARGSERPTPAYMWLRLKLCSIAMDPATDDRALRAAIRASQGQP